MAEAIGPVAAHTPTAVPWRSLGNSGRIIARDAGSTSAPAIACRTRAAISTQMLDATADKSADRTKPIKPIRNTLRRPLRSASRPPTSMKPASPIKNPDDVQATMLWPAPGNERVRSSNAMFVAVELNDTRTAPAELTASAFHARAGTTGWGCQPGSENRPAVAWGGATRIRVMLSVCHRLAARSAAISTAEI